MMAILKAFHEFPSGHGQDASVRTLAEVLVISSLLDEELEAFGWESSSQSDPSRLLAELASLFQSKVMTAVARILSQAQCTTKGGTLPAMNAIARETVRLSLEKQLMTTKAIADLVASDPALASNFLKSANTEQPGARRDIRSIAKP